jgi:isochorismate synthase
MKLHIFELHDVNVDALRTHCARHGWLIETPESLRVGFGGALRYDAIESALDSPALATTIFDDIELVGDGLRRDVGPVAFASVPFTRSGAVRVWIANHSIVIDNDSTGWLCSVNSDPRVALHEFGTESPIASAGEYSLSATTYSPTPDGYARAVAAAVDEMRRTDLQKVVLARKVTGVANEPIDAALVVSRLHQREPACTLYVFPGLDDDRLVGASPELLVSSRDGAVACHPLAGTVALPDESDALDYANWLMGSTKNLFEHRVVVDDIVSRLSERCDDVRGESHPSIVTLRSVAHLGTWIHGKVSAERPVSAFELMALLHPTPAVGGLPQRQALELIQRLEPEDRGLYAGAIGWFDSEGSGEWWVAIRGVTVQHNRFTAWAGAGIVADSDPIAEREETRDKLASILVGLGALES